MLTPALAGHSYACDTSVTIINVYGQPGSFWLFPSPYLGPSSPLAQR